jgi:MFS family permease
LSTSNTAEQSWRQWYLVAVLGMINALSQCDRAGLSVIVNPLKADLGVSDTEISLLLGLSFVALFSVLSVPAGYLVDKLNRRKLLGGAVVFWSLMETVGGAARDYWQVFLGRTGLGLGEAFVAPAVYSLIRDGVAENRRARAFALYNLTGVVGTALGSLVGGVLYNSAISGVWDRIPGLSNMRPWQIVLVVPGILGMLVALLVLTIREPPRTSLGSSDDASFSEVWRYLLLNRQRYIPVFGSFVLICIAFYGWNAWMAAAIGRTWQVPPGDVGRTAGTIGVFFSPIPTFIFAYIMDRLKARGRPAGPFWVATTCCLINICAAIYVLRAPSLQALWIAYGIWAVFSYSTVGSVCSMTLVEITPSRLVGKVTALYFLLAYTIGVGGGPYFFARVAELFFAGPGAITNAMLVCYPLSLLVTIVLMTRGAWLAARRLPV